MAYTLDGVQIQSRLKKIWCTQSMVYPKSGFTKKNSLTVEASMNNHLGLVTTWTCA